MHIYTIPRLLKTLWKRTKLKHRIRILVTVTCVVLIIIIYVVHRNSCYDKFGSYICFLEKERKLNSTELRQIEMNVEMHRQISLQLRHSYLEQLKWKDYCFEHVVNASLLRGVPLVPFSECSSPYVAIDDGGRLGNRICQYFTILIFRLHFGVRVTVSSELRSYILTLTNGCNVPAGESLCFPKNETSLVRDDFYKLYQNFYQNLHHLKSNRMDSVPVGHMNLLNMFPSCSADYFFRYRELLKEEFVLKKDIISKAARRLEDALRLRNVSRANTSLVSVHVRRTDIMADTRVFLHTKVPGEEFYKKAFAFLRKKYTSVLFLIVSDDHDWCSEYLGGSNDVVITGDSNINDPLLDFALVTLCDHHIVGLGTFAFTSAFVGKGSIVYPLWHAGVSDPLMSKYLCNDPNVFIPVAF